MKFNEGLRLIFQN